MASTQLEKFMDEFKKNVALTTASEAPDNGAISQADGHADDKLDAEGFSKEVVEDSKAGVCAEHPADGEYEGIGNANGVIVGESRSRLL